MTAERHTLPQGTAGMLPSLWWLEGHAQRTSQGPWSLAQRGIEDTAARAVQLCTMKMNKMPRFFLGCDAQCLDAYAL